MKSFFLHTAVGFFLFTCLGVTLAKEVCYGKYGCFSDDLPFDPKKIGVPQHQDEIDTKYYLYTRTTRGNVIEYKSIDDSDRNKLNESTYNGLKGTVLIIHGYKEKPLDTWIIDMKNEFLNKDEFNVIVVGWEKGASARFRQAAANTRLVGAQVAALIRFLNNQTNNTPGSFHVVGFSFGGQVCGYAGKRFHEITKTNIGRITGLDPAGRMFVNENIEVRLDASDAEFVDVIHTDASHFGTSVKSGHFDFWPNGGVDQPGCEKFKRKHLCNHHRAHQYLTASLKSQKAFHSYRCTSWEDFALGKCTNCGDGCPQMGYNAVQSKELPSGEFYLYTQNEIKGKL